MVADTNDSSETASVASGEEEQHQQQIQDDEATSEPSSPELSSQSEFETDDNSNDGGNNPPPPPIQVLGEEERGLENDGDDHGDMMESGSVKSSSSHHNLDAGNAHSGLVEVTPLSSSSRSLDLETAQPDSTEEDIEREEAKRWEEEQRQEKKPFVCIVGLIVLLIGGTGLVVFIVNEVNPPSTANGEEQGIPPQIQNMFTPTSAPTVVTDLLDMPLDDTSTPTLAPTNLTDLLDMPLNDDLLPETTMLQNTSTTTSAPTNLTD